MSSSEPKWLAWARELQSIAQDGLAYCENPYDIERYQAMRILAIEMLAHHTGFDPDQIAGIFESETGYATPKIDVRGAIIQDGTILLVRELADGGRWTLPGGWADPGDTPSEAVRREILEETGYTARVTKLAALYDRTRRGHPYSIFSTYKLFFLCEITGGEALTSHETGGVGFFTEDQLPELSLARVTLAEIHTMFEHARTPDLPTEYD
jgi:ADP-ribose pyrophosphatase YjhB (NUDIX family)